MANHVAPSRSPLPPDRTTNNVPVIYGHCIDLPYEDFYGIILILNQNIQIILNVKQAGTSPLSHSPPKWKGMHAIHPRFQSFSQRPGKYEIVPEIEKIKSTDFLGAIEGEGFIINSYLND